MSITQIICLNVISCLGGGVLAFIWAYYLYDTESVEWKDKCEAIKQSALSEREHLAKILDAYILGDIRDRQKSYHEVESVLVAARLLHEPD